MKKKVLCLIILVTLTTPWVTPLAEPVVNESNIENLVSIDDLREEIQKLDNDVVNRMVKLDELNKDIEELEKKIEKDKNDIASTEEELQKQTELLYSRVRGLYKEGNFTGVPNMLVNILTVDSLKEMFEKIDKMSYVTKTDKKLIEKNKKVKEDLEIKVSESKVAELELKTAKDEQQRSLNEISEYKIKIEEKLKVALEQERIRQEEEKRILEELRKQQEEQAKEEANNNNNNNNTEGPGSPGSGGTTGGNGQTPGGNTGGTTGGNTGGGTTKPPAINSNLAASIIAESMNYLGVDYVWGGTTPDGFDCSGLVQYVYAKYGIDLPRVSQDQQYAGTRIALSDIEPGDLIFWGEPAWHVAIYIGNGQYIHAPQTGDVVKISPLDTSRLSSAARVL